MVNVGRGLNHGAKNTDVEIPKSPAVSVGAFAEQGGVVRTNGSGGRPQGTRVHGAPKALSGGFAASTNNRAEITGRVYQHPAGTDHSQPA